MNPLFLIFGFIGVVHVIDKYIAQTKEKKIFVSFAIEDRALREMFVGQSKHSKVEYSFNDQSVREPWKRAWKTACRERIKKCDAVIILVTKNTYNAEGVIWEAKCALQEEKPTRLVYATRLNRPKKLSSELKCIPVMEWKRTDIADFINSIS